MRHALLGLVLVSTATLSAADNELNLMIDKQMTRNLTIQGYEVEVQQPTSVGVRYGRDLIGLGPAQLQLQAAYHAQSSADGAVLGTSIGTYKNTGYSLGLQAQWRLGVVLGAGAEMRVEKLKGETTYPTAGTTSATLVRPWVTGRLGFSIPTPLVKPVFGLEVAVPLTKKNANDASSDEDLLKAVAPSFEVGVYGGIRF